MRALDVFPVNALKDGLRELELAAVGTDAREEERLAVQRGARWGLA